MNSSPLISTTVVVDLEERIAAMCRQEQTHYTCANYLSSEYQLEQTRNLPSSSLIFTSLTKYSRASDISSSGSSSSGGLNEIWREKICEWSYQVVDHFDFNREIVAISLSYLDRFLATRQVNKKIFQLAAMTTLYLAIKLFETGTLQMTSLIELSRGYFTVEHIAVMEATILRSLSWHVHPPTTLAITRHLIQLLPNECERSLRHDIMELSRFLSELSVCDYYFVTRKPSSIAIASLMNAIDGIDHHRLSAKQRLEFINNISSISHLDCYSDEVVECRNRLQDMYHQGGYCNQNQMDYEMIDRVPSPNDVKSFPCGEKRK
mmetsp:Transcript_21291/g.25349  ORF Transcript_21291/g.25349 Transcript_21291/m.25349 type:complete len:320 (+) Transcript_21291:33-992(+)